MRRMVLVGLLVAGAMLAMGASDALTGDDLVDGTVNAEQLGADVTRIKALTLTVAPGADIVTCPEGGAEDGSDCVSDDSGAGMQTFTVRCPSGNVASGAVRPIDLDGAGEAVVEVVQSWPISDAAWRLVVFNHAAEPARVQARVVCL